MSQISDEKIPNNVNLTEDKKLQRALEQWQPNFLRWWMEMGPEGFQAHDDQRGCGWLGALRFREDAGVPLGDLPGRADARPEHRLRRFDGAAGVDRRPRRTPKHAATADRHARRHRARIRGAAAPAGK